MSAILNTDMARHRKLLSKTSLAYPDRCAAGGSAPSAPPTPKHDTLLLDDRSLLVSFLLHTARPPPLPLSHRLTWRVMRQADINCPTFEVGVARRVARTLSWEFAQQNVAEQRLGLPPTAFACDTDAAAARHEASFIDFVALPLYRQCVSVVPLYVFTSVMLTRACCRLAVLAPKLGALCLERINANRRAWVDIAEKGNTT